MGNQIHYIKHNKIDFNKWDNLVERAEQGTVYSYSWWLSAFCQWDIIVLNDYEAGIPVPQASGMFIQKIHQPNFIQQCLWLGTLPDDDILPHISKLIASKSQVIHFNSNLPLDFSVTERKNQILDIREASEVQAGYSKSLSKNIKKQRDKVLVSENQDIQHTIDKYTAAYGSLNTQLKPIDYLKIKNLAVSKPENFINLTLYLNKQPVAGLLFAKGKNRLHYILGAPTADGRKVNALSIGIHYIIKKYGSSYAVLDFEGSSIPSVHQFYRSFGSEVETFYELSHMPYWLKMPLRVYKRLFKS